ncbi:MAG: thiamine phosphate synthase [Deltaproteobacteria bacterium]|nr:thiamine phosphate synthase [Deltaproteobacteria bacterium]MBK8719966.1 thiamine phosphate synthase [Deltaproteobacteria bacterium]MBP7291350.1 thiamine phosphate synthase [Nannocystaceae bacterium]
MLAQVRLLAITPPEGAADPARIDAWFAHGARDRIAIWLRVPGAAPAQVMNAHAALVHAARGRGVPLLLGCASVDLERAASLVAAYAMAGVVLRGDPDRDALAEARARLGPSAWVLRSCHDADAAGHPHCDATVLGPVFAPRTPKPGAATPLGPGALARMARAPGARVFALGGIDGGNALACITAGAHGLAGIAAFFGAPAQVAADVGAMVRALG